MGSHNPNFVKPHPFKPDAPISRSQLSRKRDEVEGGAKLLSG